MPGQYRIKRRTHQLALLENQVTQWDLPRGYDYEALFFRLTGQSNVTVAGAGVRAIAPSQLIKRIEVIADGKNTIASVPFSFLGTGNFSRPNRGALVAPTAAAVALYAIYASGALDFQLVDGVRPKDSNLRTAGMQQLQLRITTGASNDMYTGAVASAMTTFGLDVYTSELVELPDEKGNITKPLYIQKRAYQDVALIANNANQQVILPIGNVLRGVEMYTQIGGESSNLVLNNVQLASGVDVRINLPANDLQGANAMDYSPFGMITAPTAAGSGNVFPTGWYMADLMSFGGHDVKVTDGWDLTRASEAKLIADVNGGATNLMTVTTFEFLQ